MTAPSAYLLAGGCLLLAVLLPSVTRRFAVSPAMVLLLTGVGIGLTPWGQEIALDPVEDRLLIQHVTEITVLVALMGVGLALDRPLDLRKPATWRRWSPTWRLLAIGMPVTIVGVSLLGWAGLGLAPASALLLGALLSPTDPVLAADVQVSGPGSGMADVTEDEPYPEDPTVISEQGEVRFALTSEAGLNDGLAFPFVHAAILMASGTSLLSGAGTWLGWYLVGKIAVGVVVGLVIGRLLARIAFRSRRPSFRLAEQGEPLLALAALLASYGAAELLQGYGFLSVFTCAMALRAAERGHDYHRGMHSVVERLERLFTLAVLIFLGIGLSSGLLDYLDWRGALTGALLVLLIRPLAGWASIALLPRRPGLPGGITPRGRHTIAFSASAGSAHCSTWRTPLAMARSRTCPGCGRR